MIIVLSASRRLANSICEELAASPTNPNLLVGILDANKIPPAIAQELLDHLRIVAILFLLFIAF
jgi:hypothetical protein